MSALEQLLQISSSALISTPIPDAIPLVAPFGALGTELHALLARRNGFYAFESALHVFPFGSAVDVLDLASWNAEETWRWEYGDLASDCLFFAEDAFGFQFCLKAGQVCTFDPETGGVTPIARSLEDWGAALLIDFRVLLGHPVRASGRRRTARSRQDVVSRRAPLSCSAERSRSRICMLRARSSS